MLSWIYPFFEGFTVTTWLCTLLITALAVALWRNASSRGLRLPPGPFSLPLIGHMLKLKDNPHLYYEGLRKKYGDIFGLYVGVRYTVVINGPKLMKEMAMMDEFTGKPPGIFALSPDYGHIADLNGEDWREQRKFILKAFRNLGMGRPDGETAVQVQISGFLEQLKTAVKKDDPWGISIRDFLFQAVNNIIFTFICNRTFQDDKKFLEMMREFTLKTNDYFFSKIQLYYLPWTKPFTIFKSVAVKEDFERQLIEVRALVKHEVEIHEKNYTGVENLDFIDYYIEQLRQPQVHKSFSRPNMLGNSEVFILAGSDTIRFLMQWYILYLIKDQDMQERIYQELVKAAGKERVPEWDDRPKMPYMQAVLLEIQRHKVLIPLNSPRMTCEDVKFGGYEIPKNTNVIMNFYSVHQDTELWGDPENFRPERFLTPDGKGINSMEKWLTTFSLGKRNCPGDKLANVHLFLYIAAIIQAYKIVEPRAGFQYKELVHFATDLENFRIGLIPRD